LHSRQAEFGRARVVDARAVIPRVSPLHQRVMSEELK